MTEKMIGLKKLGIDHFFPLHIAADTPEDLVEQYQILAEEVVPMVNSA